MRFFTGLQALLSGSKPKEGSEVDDMPDIATQTSPRWNVLTTSSEKEATNASVSTPRLRMSSKMNETTWGDCWKLIERYASQHKAGPGTSLPAIKETAKDQEILDVPPTPGSGKGAYCEPDPGWKEPNLLDEITEGVSDDGLVGETEPEVDGTAAAEAYKKMSDQEYIEYVKPPYCPTPAPTYSPSTFGSGSTSSSPEFTHTTIDSELLRYIDASRAPVTPAAQAADIRAQISAFHALINVQPQTILGDDGATNGPKLSKGIDPTMPSISNGVLATGLNPGTDEQILGAKVTVTVPARFYEDQLEGTPITAKCEGETDIDPTGSWLKEFKNVDAIDGSKVENIQDELGMISIASSGNKGVSAKGPSTPRTRELEKEPDHHERVQEHDDVIGFDPGQYQARIEIAETMVPEALSASATTLPPQMAVKFPDDFHQQVLETAIERGADYETQQIILEGLRGVERTATLDELAEGTGAKEVEASELIAPSAIQPVATASTGTLRSGRKRKSDGDEQASSKKPRPATQIKALTNDEHFAQGWEYLPRTHFNGMKVPQIKDYMRTILDHKRWWNGLNRRAMIDKIMEWQHTMKELQATQAPDLTGQDSEVNHQADKEGHDSDARVPFGDNHVEEREVTAWAPSVVADQTFSQVLPSYASTAHSQKSTTPSNLPATPTEQSGNMGFVRSSSASLASNKSIFFDPDAVPRNTPLIQKFQDVKQDAMHAELKLMHRVESATWLRSKSRSKSILSTADSAKDGLNGHEEEYEESHAEGMTARTAPESGNPEEPPSSNNQRGELTRWSTPVAEEDI